jgi:hypothetical protein
VGQTGYLNLGLVLVTMCLVACGPNKMSIAPAREFPQRVTDGRAELRWDCSRTEAGEVRIEGVANNPFFPQPIRGLQVQVFGVDTNGVSVQRTSARTRDFLIRTNAPSPFEATFMPLSTDVRYDLMYVYRIDEGRRLSDRGGEERSFARNICPDLTR